MLASLGSIASQQSLPTGSRHLLHFENNLRDEIQNANASSVGPVTYSNAATDKKFGEYGVKTETAVSISLPNSVIDWAAQNFTVSGWIRPVNVTLTREQLVNVSNADDANKFAFALLKLSDSSGSMSVRFQVLTAGGVTYTVDSGLVVPQSSMSFVKFGRKDDKIFLVIGGVKQTGGNPNIGAGVSLKANTTEPIRFGANGGTNYLPAHDAYFDEWLVQLGVGDDSLDVPTQPWA